MITTGTDFVGSNPFGPGWADPASKRSALQRKFLGKTLERFFGSLESDIRWNSTISSF